jgi:nitric oxide reductase subunit B
MFWILLGATGCVLTGLEAVTKKTLPATFTGILFALWFIAVAGIFYSYSNGHFGGREYWEFNPVFALL